MCFCYKQHQEIKLSSQPFSGTPSHLSLNTQPPAPPNPQPQCQDPDCSDHHAGGDASNHAGGQAGNGGEHYDMDDSC